MMSGDDDSWEPEVAELRRALPPGGPLKQDYGFEEAVGGLNGAETAPMALSALFGGKDDLVLYSFMYREGNETPCGACTSLLDGLNGVMGQIRQRAAFAVVARAPIGRIRAWARGRGWANHRLLSSAGTSYNADYHGENPDGLQIPMVNVFRKGADGIRHMYGTELLFVAPEPGQHPRHADALWPLWGVLDLTPSGRGTDWFPDI